MTAETKPECSVCCEDYSIIQQISSVCGHDDLCPVCIRRHIEAELNTKGDVVQVRCPKSLCSIELNYDDVQRLAPKELFDRYDTLLLRAAIRKLPDFRWCKAQKCGSGQEHTTGDRLPIITCGACGAKSCFTHDVPWHEGLTCVQFTEQLQTKDYAANRAYYERHTKQCPKCQMSIEKNDGCDHMSCRCGYEFCWLCLGDYDNIRKYGNHYHAPTCQYYAAYNSDDEYDDGGWDYESASEEEVDEEEVEVEEVEVEEVEVEEVEVEEVEEEEVEEEVEEDEDEDEESQMEIDESDDDDDLY